VGLITSTTPQTAALAPPAQTMPPAQRAAQRGSWAWYRNRLSVMKPAEMLYRARHAASSASASRRVGSNSSAGKRDKTCAT